MYDVVIVGAGPAGMTAAIYALRNNKRVALVEKNVPGGVIVNTAFVEYRDLQRRPSRLRDV